MNSIVRVELYKNAVRVKYILPTVYNNSVIVYNKAATKYTIIKIRFYQRSRARNIIEKFYLYYGNSFQRRDIEWQYEDMSKVLKWDFETNSPK